MTLNFIKIWIWELKPWVNNPLKPQFSGCFAIVVLGGERGHHITTYLIYTVFEGVVLLLDNTLYWSSLFRLFTRIMRMKDSLRTKMSIVQTFGILLRFAYTQSQLKYLSIFTKKIKVVLLRISQGMVIARHKNICCSWVLVHYWAAPLKYIDIQCILR